MFICSPSPASPFWKLFHRIRGQCVVRRTLNARCIRPPKFSFYKASKFLLCCEKFSNSGISVVQTQVIKLNGWLHFVCLCYSLAAIVQPSARRSRTLKSSKYVHTWRQRVSVDCHGWICHLTSFESSIIVAAIRRFVQTIATRTYCRCCRSHRNSFHNCKLDLLPARFDFSVRVVGWSVVSGWQNSLFESPFRELRSSCPTILSFPFSCVIILHHDTDGRKGICSICTKYEFGVEYRSSWYYGIGRFTVDHVTKTAALWYFMLPFLFVYVDT